jgi:hypothetical protein
MRASSFHAVRDSMSHSISTISAAKGHAGAGCQPRSRLRWMLRTRAEAMPEPPGTLGRFAARRQETGGRAGVDVRKQQSFFAVRLVTEERAVRPYHC